MTCDDCGLEMPTADGCTVEHVRFTTGSELLAYQRIPYGDEGDGADWLADFERCPECGVKPGRFHHPGCDVEACPKCSYQAISCECS